MELKDKIALIIKKHYDKDIFIDGTGNNKCVNEICDLVHKEKIISFLMERFITERLASGTRDEINEILDEIKEYNIKTYKDLYINNTCLTDEQLRLQTLYLKVLENINIFKLEYA